MTSKSLALAPAEPNVTPMLDVLLVLLIIFLAASVRVIHSLDAQLPPPCTDACTGGASIVLEVLPGPAYRINSSDVPASELGARIASIYRDRPEKILQVSGDRRVSYEMVVHAMDVAKANGVNVIAVSPRASAASSH
jgi:biopolymer transport protein ExbD